MITGLLNEFIIQGDRGAVVPFSRIENLKKDMMDLQNGEFHTEWLNRMANHITDEANKFIPSDFSVKPCSLITVLIPSPKVILKFNYNGKLIPVEVPTHYTNWDKNNDRVLKYIIDYLKPHGYTAAKAVTLSHKLLAVHSGLALYGRNNICYNDDYGSYMQIMSYISDLPCNESPWFPIRRMESCENCRVCVTSCPTGAIDFNRQLINSDRCITLVNELPDEFPIWIKKNAHNSIIGCSICQDCCPVNAINKNNIKLGATFTEEETAELLNHKGNEPYSESLSVKIEMAGILQEYTNPNVLPRNLAMLIL